MSDNIDLTKKEVLEAQEKENRSFSSIRELILPLKRPDTETYDDYKARRMMSNAVIKFYFKHHHWPKVDAQAA